MLNIILIILICLCWGSFLNVVAYRLTYDKPFFTSRSYCPHCGKTLAWFDMVPVLSWIFLLRRCRVCKHPISVLYPLIEIFTTIIVVALYFKMFPAGFSFDSFFPFISYFIFFSALICAIRTDFQEMVIPQIVSLWLVPIGVLFSFLGGTIVSGFESIIGACVGYGVLWIIAKLFNVLTKKEGLGVGDMELLALIGSFLGPIGAWFALMIGSLLGLIIGGTFVCVLRIGPSAPIPFGPFLALGATLYFFFNSLFLTFLFG